MVVWEQHYGERPQTGRRACVQCIRQGYANFAYSTRNHTRGHLTCIHRAILHMYDIDVKQHGVHN